MFSIARIWDVSNFNIKNFSSDAFVVYRLACSPSERKFKYSNPVQGNQPQLTAKAVYRTPSHFTTWNGPLNRKTFGEVNPLSNDCF